MVAESVTAYDEPAFLKALRADIAKHHGRALVFIHWLQHQPSTAPSTA